MALSITVGWIRTLHRYRPPVPLAVHASSKGSEVAATASPSAVTPVPTPSWVGVDARFDAEVVADGGYTPRYNIAPGEDLYIITNEAHDEIDAYHWGLIPFWADEPEEGIVNARSETADEKRLFERAWESRLCLVLSSGFYEWKAPNGGSKQPHRIHCELLTTQR